MKVNIKGQSLFEVVVALAMAALIITSVVVLATLSIKSTSFSRNKTLATRHAQEAVEWLRGQRDNNLTEFKNNISISQWCLSDLSWNVSNQGPCGDDETIPNTNFLRSSSFTVGVNEIVVEVVVSWTDSIGFHQTNVNTIFTDWRTQ